MGRTKTWAWLALAPAIGLVLWLALPSPKFSSPYATVVLDSDGRLLGAQIAADGQWRFPPLQACPPRFATALVAYEDRRFFFHPGVDPMAFTRAAWQNLKSGKVRSGGSTLTMQVIRMSRVKPATPHARGFGTKILEALAAIRLELSASKEEVLALYASHAPFGGNVVGIDAAAWRYFGRSSQQLSWGEAALLAVLPNQPSMLHPGRNREPLRHKRDRLLTKLWQQGAMDSVTCALAKLEGLPEKPMPLPRSAPHLVASFAASNSNTKAAAIHRTSIDANLQDRVNDILRHRQRDWQGQGIANGAVLVLDTKTGEPLAYAGNVPDPNPDMLGGNVDIITSRRSTGSLLKPFLYAAMLEAGEILPGTLIADVPTQIGGYAPLNFDRAFEGAVPARMALARSLNVPAIRMLKNYGVERFHRHLHELGMTTIDRPSSNYGLTLVLGGAEGTLRELAGLYAALAREALANDTQPKIIGTASAWLTLQAMAEVSRPDAQKYWRNFSSSRWVAWKTGTSFGFRDAWAIGVTPEFVVGVWVGNASGLGRPGLTGIQMAAPVLFDVFNALPPTTVFPMPLEPIQLLEVCRASGMRTGPHCDAVDSVWVPRAATRTAACPYHRVVHLDPTGEYQVHDGCQSVSTMQHRKWFVLPPTQEWYYRQRHSDYSALPDWRSDCRDGADVLGKAREMDLIYPKWGAGIYIPVDLDSEKSRAIFEAVHRNPSATVYWHLDQQYLGETREFHKMTVNPSPGKHTLLLVDDKGERLERQIEVLTKDAENG